MEPLWQLVYEIPIGNIITHHTKLYKYTDNTLALVSTEEFCKAFSKNFKILSGKYSDLVVINNDKHYGWLFNMREDLSSNLLHILKEIYENKIQPTNNTNDKVKNINIFKLLSEAVSLIPEEEGNFILQEKNNVKTVMFFNRESPEEEGNTVYHLEAGNKKLEIVQFIN